MRLRDDLAGAAEVKQVYHAANPVDAQLAVDRLAAEGIHAHTQGQFLSGAAGELPVGELLRVWVADDAHVARAKSILAAHARGEDALDSDSLDPLFERSWARAWQGLDANGDWLELRDALLAAWGEPQRRYHTLRHLRDCLALLEPVLAQAERPAEVEIALWFHDAVYDPKAKDNEFRSSVWAVEALAPAGVPIEALKRIDGLIIATCHDARPDSHDQQLLVDVDLAILGAQPERFDEYETEVREEYAWVPGAVFRHKRREILAEFLERTAIFSTEGFREQFEVQARENLQHAIGRLRPWWKIW